MCLSLLSSGSAKILPTKLSVMAKNTRSQADSPVSRALPPRGGGRPGWKGWGPLTGISAGPSEIRGLLQQRPWGLRWPVFRTQSPMPSAGEVAAGGALQDSSGRWLSPIQSSGADQPLTSGWGGAEIIIETASVFGSGVAAGAGAGSVLLCPDSSRSVVHGKP